MANNVYNAPVPARKLVWLAFILLGACARTEPTSEPVRAVRTMEVAAVDSQLQYEYPAEVRARVESRLGFRVGGKITRRLVEIGEVVRPGQILARLDPQDLQLGQDAARAALAATKANLDIQETEFRRYKELREQGFISSLELDRREATLKAARAQTDQAKALAAVQGHQAQYAELMADGAGVVVAVDAEPGAVVSAGTTVLRVALDGPRDVVFSVPEDRVASMRVAMASKSVIAVRLQGAAGPLVTARLHEIGAAADAVTRTFLVKADIGTAPHRLGQSAVALVNQAALTGAIRLPLTAVFEHQGQSAVWLLDRTSMTVRPAPIAVAGADGNLVVVASGVRPGQTVVTAGVHTLSPGKKVRLYVEPATPQVHSAASASAAR